VRPRPGQAAGEPAAVIVERYRPGYAVRVRFAQARCADSQIVEVDADAPHAFGFGGMLARPTVLDYASGSRLRSAHADHHRSGQPMRQPCLLLDASLARRQNAKEAG